MNDLILFCPSSYYASQKKTLEINPRHPLVKTLLAKVEDDTDDVTAKDLAVVMYETAVLRSGFQLQDSAAFAGRIERMLKISMNLDPNERVRTTEKALFNNPFTLTNLGCMSLNAISVFHKV